MCSQRGPHTGVNKGGGTHRCEQRGPHTHVHKEPPLAHLLATHPSRRCSNSCARFIILRVCNAKYVPNTPPYLPLLNVVQPQLLPGRGRVLDELALVASLGWGGRRARREACIRLLVSCTSRRDSEVGGDGGWDRGGGDGGEHLGRLWSAFAVVAT